MTEEATSQGSVVTWHFIVEGYPESKGAISFLRDHVWAITDFHFEFTENGVTFLQEGHCRYDHGCDGKFPLLSFYEFKKENVNQGKRNIEQHYIYEITNIVPGLVPLDEFDPEKVLDIKIGGTSANWTMRLILLGIGLVLIAVWFYSNRKADICK